MKYYIFTYGCQMNESDSERIVSLLEQSGHRPAKNAKRAGLIVINACSVRQAAIDRVYGQINNFPGKKIIIAGCLLDFDKKRLAQNKNIAFWSPDEYFELPPARLASQPAGRDGQGENVAGRPLRTNKNTAYVPIMTGCNNFCSYCVVPYTRGREKSRPAKEILTEIKSLIKNNYKEIILLGQNVNSYHSSLRGGAVPLSGTAPTRPASPSRRRGEQSRIHRNNINFAALLKTINDIPGDFRLFFLTSHPKDMSDELIKTMARCAKLKKELHLPVQNGDNQILKKMNRRYTAGHYKNLIKKVRKAIPDVKISTDIIVGFPGETKKQFQNTVRLCKEVKFDKAYIAKYSPRTGTAAAKLPDSVSPQEKKKRWRTLDTLVNKFQH